MLENIVQNRIGHAAYGTFAALYALGFLFISLTDLGLNIYTTKKLSAESENLKEYFSNAFAIKIILCMLYPLFMSGVGWILGYSLGDIYFLAILCFTQAIFQVVLFFRSVFQAKQRFRLDSIISVADKVILMLIVLFTLYNQLNLKIYIYSRLLSAVITLVGVYIIILPMVGTVRPSLNAKKMRKVLSYSIPFAVMTVLYSINEKVDQLMLERIGHELEARVRAGLYAGAYRWVEIFQMYLWTIFPFFFARLAFYYKEPEKLQKVFNMGQVLAAVPMTFVTAFIYFHGEKLFWIFSNSSPEELHTMVKTTKVLFLSVCMNGYFAIYGLVLTCFGQEKKLSLVVIVSIIINIGLNLIFIPKYGTYAAAWNTLASVTFLSISYVIMVSRFSPLTVPFRVLKQITLAGILFLGVFQLLELFSNYWYLNTFLAGLFLLLICYILGIFQYIRQNV